MSRTFSSAIARATRIEDARGFLGSLQRTESVEQQGSHEVHIVSWSTGASIVAVGSYSSTKQEVRGQEPFSWLELFGDDANDVRYDGAGI